MATRKKAPLEERLRACVRAQIPVLFGNQRTFAEKLGRPESWVTTYLDGKSHPDLDTTAAIATTLRDAGFRLNADQLLVLDPLPDADPLTVQLLEYWNAVEDRFRPGLLETIAPFVRMVAPGAVVRHIAPRPAAGKPSGTRSHRKRHAGGE